ncbi:related to septin family protein (P-loop GTPase) [Fusarium torulosum]|uniref:Related to septin family protein (P-loop GTPase) n=1 Tax=Fusarium torulosum TaxID=33205 RepID=A0AAE8MN71_9HYPO|nr:related to septin family protein (P-loop GTPase) [Fusarium torulosum]
MGTLRELDIELMKRHAPRSNVIPVIGRADSLPPAELAQSKKLIMEDIEHYRIPVYNFPYDIEEYDEETIEENAELRGMMPFAIVGSEEFIKIGGRKVCARQYPWGIVEVDNPHHSDFLALRSALLHSYLLDLKEITYDFLYEMYRTEKLSKITEGGNGARLRFPANTPKRGAAPKEKENFRKIEMRIQQEIKEKSQELLVREAELRDIEARINREAAVAAAQQEAPANNQVQANRDGGGQ